jgi:hypothetical protein
MFAEVEGPTALRADIVYGLAFSVEEASCETGCGSERCVSALAAVWNGKQGFVAVLVRSLERPEVSRYEYSEEISDVTELHLAIETGLGFAVSLGFLMDEPDFLGLEPAERDRRIDRWNKLRKPEKAPQSIETQGATPGRGESGEALAGDGAGAVLGRVELIRQDESNDRPTLLGRLLGFY